MPAALIDGLTLMSSRSAWLKDDILSQIAEQIKAVSLYTIYIYIFCYCTAEMPTSE